MIFLVEILVPPLILVGLIHIFLSTRGLRQDKKDICVEYTPSDNEDDDLQKAADHLSEKYLNDTNVVGIGIAKIVGASYLTIYTAKGTKKYPKKVGQYPVIVSRIGRIKPL